MINENMKFEKKETISFPLLKNDIYNVELWDVNVEQKTKYKSEELEDVLRFEFVVLNGKDTEGNDARLRLVSKNYIPTYLYISAKTGKNNLYKIVEAIIGRDLNKEEEANGITGKTLNYLVGKQVRVLLEKQQSKTDSSKTYNVISNFLPIENPSPSLTEEEKKKIKEIKETNKEEKTEVKETEDYDVSEAEKVEISVDKIPF